MFKIAIACAVLLGVAATVRAQSSVTVYGTIDLNGRYIKNDGSPKRLSMSQDGINSSQLGFRGVEDLGDGLKASFVLLAGVNADTGSTNSKFFNRRSTVSISGRFGEIRLGRDYTPTFWNSALFDPFGAVGLGSAIQPTRSWVQTTFARADNSIGYFLPSGLGGVYGQVMVAAGEGVAQNSNKYVGARLGYAAGPIDIAVHTSKQDLTPGKYDSTSAAGSYDFNVVKLFAEFYSEKLTIPGGFSDRRYLVGVVVPFGQSEIHASYNKTNSRVDSNDMSQIALGYVYNLSKRTALYGTVSELKNSGKSNVSIGTAISGYPSDISAAPTPGGRSKGAEVGVRHFF